MPQTTGKSFRCAVVSVIEGLPPLSRSIVRRVRFKLKVEQPIRLADFCEFLQMNRSQTATAMGEALRDFYRQCRLNHDIREWTEQQGRNLESQRIVFWLLGKDD